MSVSESFKMAEWANNNERDKADIKRSLILFSLDTLSRLNTCLNLKWTDFEAGENDDEINVHYVSKDNKDRYMKISKPFYNALINDLKEKYNSEYVFPISSHSVSAMMKRYKTAFNMTQRNIVFHSIRGGSFTTKWLSR
jgi:integrase